MTLIRLTRRKPEISTGSNGPLGSEKDLASFHIFSVEVFTYIQAPLGLSFYFAVLSGIYRISTATKYLLEHIISRLNQLCWWNGVLLTSPSDCAFTVLVTKSLLSSQNLIYGCLKV